MIDVFSSVILSGVLGAQLILTLVLLKGDICPGQRGRLHKVFWFLVVGWGAITPLFSFAALPFISLGIFSLRSKTGKTKLSGPIPLLHLSNAFGVLALVVAMFQSPLGLSLLMLFQVVLVGAVTAHLLLIRARSRLQAFHRILPVIGVISAMLMAAVLAVLGSANATDAMVQHIVVCMGLALTGILIWVSHLFRQVVPTLLPVFMAYVLLFSASFVAIASVSTI
ncbi:hypothetical protein [Enterovibrio nigricans]|uniref:Uncharacterized protein n=1 Tax=Enterovibrio nigricans DSM 22720 TaxID=1121868 RepID=A0A1T4VKQ2_9GAMM|nr:hypothetical protein [Enterovibrio nigricans]PKF49657.1 hypothetical protein AT251_17275 [Enterovibrio nigricans]SKA65448.1 hypothetical protein SAMN02745132_03960 [Enterovibrio nigricans DSM 22720]